MGEVGGGLGAPGGGLSGQAADVTDDEGQLIVGDSLLILFNTSDRSVTLTLLT